MRTCGATPEPDAAPARPSDMESPARRLIRALAPCLVGLGVLASCGTDAPGSPDPGATVAVRGATPEVAPDEAAVTGGPRITDEESADVLLYISNQSFEDDRVRITVHIDGVRLVDDDFDVEGQHNWILFPVELAPGEHRIEAVSDTGASLEQTLTLPEGERRWAVLDYWFYPDQGDDQDDVPRMFTFEAYDHPVAFA